jgi:hypothetical protein
MNSCSDDSRHISHWPREPRQIPDGRQYRSKRDIFSFAALGARSLVRKTVNPQSNPQSSMSCTTCAYFGSLRALLSRCKTYWGQIHTVELKAGRPFFSAILRPGLLMLRHLRWATSTL